MSAPAPSAGEAVAPFTGNPFAGVVLGGPKVISSFARAIDPISGFFGAAALPEGTDIARTFGIRSPKALAGPTTTPIANPFEFGLGTGVSTVGLRDRPGRGGFFSSLEPGGPNQLAQFTSEALSFTPRIAERGERRIQEFLDAPITPPGRRRAADFFLKPVFRALGVPQRQVATEAARRVAAVAAARVSSAEVQASNPFFQAVAESVRLGRLPNAVASPAAIQAFALQDQTAFAPLPRLVSVPAPAVPSVVGAEPAPVTLPRTAARGVVSVAPQPTPVRGLVGGAAVRATSAAALGGGAGVAPATQASMSTRLFQFLFGTPGGATSPSLRGVRPKGGTLMPSVPTGGLFSGFAGGLADVIQASTPLLSAILPSLVRQPAQVAFPGVPISGTFADPRIQQAGLGDFLMGGGFLGQPQIPQIAPVAGACPPRLPSRIDVPTTTASGAPRFVTFKNMGAPILFSGDLAACRRVKRVGKRVRKSVGGR